MRTFFGRLCEHLYQVITEAIFAVLKLRVPVRVAVNFFVMRLLTPFGFSRGWDGPRPVAENRVVDTLRADGFAELHPLKGGTVADLRRFFCNRVGGEGGQGFTDLDGYFEASRNRNIQRPPGVLATGHPDCAITSILFDDRYIDLAAKFLGIHRSRLIAAGSMDALIRLSAVKIETGYDDALEFHRDVDSYRFVKMFVYLTDCRIDGGHHEIYLGSHRHTPPNLGPIARYSNAEIETSIPDARLFRVEGEAGFGFVENTFAFHRGTKPTTGDRLILNLQYMDDSFLDYYKTAFRVPASVERTKVL